MEVYYGRYDLRQRQSLLEMAERYDLMSSAGSDFHSGEPEYEKLTRSSFPVRAGIC